VSHPIAPGLDLAERQRLDGPSRGAEVESRLGRPAHERRVEKVEKRAAAHSPRVAQDPWVGFTSGALEREAESNRLLAEAMKKAGNVVFGFEFTDLSDQKTRRVKSCR
jgi:hypothetical protein